MIIARPSKHSLTRETIENCYHENSDGFGIMHAENDQVLISRGFKLDDLFAAYDAIPADRELAIHFRWRTHGDIDDRNLHPYEVLKRPESSIDLHAMHNGVIRIVELDKTMSDTYHWLQLKVIPILRRDPALLQLPEFRDCLEDGIDHSRILFLDNAGNWTFLNESSWIKHEGCYFSSRPPARRVVKPYAGATAWKQDLQARVRAQYEDFWERDGWNEPDYPLPTKRPAALLAAELPDEARSVASADTAEAGTDAGPDDEDAADDHRIYGNVLTPIHFASMSFDEALAVVEDSPEMVAEFLCSQYGLGLD